MGVNDTVTGRIITLEYPVPVVAATLLGGTLATIDFRVKSNAPQIVTSRPREAILEKIGVPGLFARFQPIFPNPAPQDDPDVNDGTVTISSAPAAATLFTVTAPANVATGGPFDSHGHSQIDQNRITDYSGTVQFASE